jgi:hypothetical protein
VVGGMQNDSLVVGLAEGASLPVLRTSPNNAIRLAAANGDPDAIRALDNDNADDFYKAGTTFGAAADIKYRRVNTLGLSADYFEPTSGVVFRLESSYSFNEPLQNTRKADWYDESDVVRFSLGMDRPTFLKFLNHDRTFFLSAQIFNTIFLDHEGGPNTGNFVGADNWIFTFFAQTNYMRDQLTPQGFIVWEEESDSWVAGIQSEYKFDNHWSAVVGANWIWGGRRDEDFSVGPFTSFSLNGQLSHEAIFGFAKQGIGALRDNDEVFARVRYQF